ncbi:MAG TPA: zinc-ribbon domain-containing protein [Gemmatimonadales bacterium]|nr:zinc-ribbon domain-containing protein [Gemmatimonadales bacterium]
MNVTCPSCETVYRVDPAKVPTGGVRARCAVCSNVFPVNAAAGAATGGASAAAAARPPAPPLAPTPPAPAPAPPRAPAMPRFSGAIAAPTSAPTPPAPPAPPPAAAPRAAPPAAPRAAPAPAAPPSAPTMRPAAPPAAPAPRAAPPPPAPPAPRAAGTPAAPPAPAGAAPAQRLSGPLRPVNPFMVQDPKQKARRLARALVSDLVVYHPEKRQQGLRDGTLPQLFKDEIEKSWQEYVDQVGGEIAKTTPFWAEALNEILAGGNKVF